MNHAAVLRWWGCCAPNRLADRAIRYRRIALALASLPVPLVAMAVVLMMDGRSARHAVAHIAVAVGSGWLAFDLVDRASSLNRHGRPHASSVVLLVGLGLLIGVAVVEPMAGFRPPVLLGVGLGTLVAGYLVLVVAERCDDQGLFVVGRSLVAAAAIVVAAVQLAQSILGFTTAPLYATGLAAVSAVLLVMGWCEARVLRRGAALYRALARR